MFSRPSAFGALTRRLHASRVPHVRFRGTSFRLSLRSPVLGVDVRGSKLEIACLRTGWRTGRLLGVQEIPDFERLGSDHLRSALQEFLRPLRGERPVVVVGLPRTDAVVRLFDLPSSAGGKNLRSAMNLQFEMYKPADREAFCWDAAATAANGRVLGSLVMVRRDLVEMLARLFSEAGYPINRLTLTQSSMLKLVQSLPQASTTGQLICLCLGDKDAELAVLEANRLRLTRTIPTASLNAHPEREIGQALGAIHFGPKGERGVMLSGQAPPWELEEFLAGLGPVHRLSEWAPIEGFPNGDPHNLWGAIALSLDGIGLTGNARPNLLPTHMRPPRRKWRHFPTYVLLSVLLLLLAGLGIREPVQRRLLLRQYHRETANLRQPVQALEGLLNDQERLRGRLRVLTEFRQRGRRPLEALVEVSRQLPDDAWLNLFSCQQNNVSLTGSAQSASAVLPLINASPLFEDAQFSGSLTRDSSGAERFHLQARIEGSS